LIMLSRLFKRRVVQRSSRRLLRFQIRKVKSSRFYAGLFNVKSDLAINFESIEDPNKPVMSMVPSLVFGESGKLASYYWLFAQKQGSLDQVEKDFDKITKFRENEKDLNHLNVLVYSAKYEPVERAKAFSDPAISRLTLHPTTQKILADLCLRERQVLLWSIIEDFKYLMKSYRHEIDVSIILPAIPSAEYFELLYSKIINEYLSPESKINLTIEIDPTISRGYKIRMGHKSVDNTWNSDLLKRSELEEQDNMATEKKIQSLYPKVYEVKLPSQEENVKFALKLIEKISSEKVSIPITPETSKTVSELQKSSSSLNPGVFFYD